MTTSSKEKLQFEYNRQFTSLLICTCFVCMFSSCLISKPGNYFNSITRDTTINNTTPLPGELKIKTGDILSISISSLSKLEDELFSLKPSTLNSVAEGYPVDEEGNIHLHKLGKLKVAGLTRKELKILLEKELQPYLKDPIIAVSFSNHHIILIGEISEQKIVPVLNENISITDALAQSGNITTLTKLSDVLIIRENGNSKIFKHVNLENNSIFSSPYYYLQPNDVVVLNQDEKIVKQQLKRDKYQQYSAVILQSISVALIIYQVFIRR